MKLKINHPPKRLKLQLSGQIMNNLCMQDIIMMYQSLYSQKPKRN